MKKFRVLRSDVYEVEFEAKNLKEAERKLEEDDNLMNSGAFSESKFGVIEEV